MAVYRKLTSKEATQQNSDLARLLCPVDLIKKYKGPLFLCALVTALTGPGGHWVKPSDLEGYELRSCFHEITSSPAAFALI